MVLGVLWLVACTAIACLPSPLPSLGPTAVPAAKETALPTPADTAPDDSAPQAGEAALTLPAAPYERYLNWGVDPNTGVPFAMLDRASFDAAHEKPAPRTFKLVYLENQYLRLSFLPELGGRLYQVVFKPTQQSLFYNNPVIVPSGFGPFASDRNWWLAAGGMEWTVPVQEHGYEWGVPWRYHTEVTRDAASITLSDSDAPDRLRTEVTVTLRRGEAAWSVSPSVENPTGRDMRVQFWVNAMLTLGSPSMSPATQFRLPAASVRVHSTGERRLPSAQQTMSWPTYANVDWSDYRNWGQWLGVFSNDPGPGWDGAYNPDTDLGIVRVYPPASAPGVKLFAFGPKFADRSYTDDGSQYFELWGGPNRSFWPADDVSLAAGGALRWTESWYPVSGMGGLNYGNARAALNLAVRAGQFTAAVSAPVTQRGRLTATSNGRTVLDTTVALAPGQAFTAHWTAAAGETSPAHVQLRWLDEQGNLLAQAETELNLQ